MRIVVLSLALAGLACAAQAEPVRVPFVGCPSDGQLGFQSAPKDDDKAPVLSALPASRLTWYAGNYVGGVLAPKGWRCFELYGSNGASLLITPTELRDPFKAKLTGPAVQLSVSVGDTSGRFEAARMAARLFPNRKAFVDHVIAEGIEPKSAFVFGPFPNDHVERIGRDVVAFETPANLDGMGTKSRLVKSADPIEGLVVMDGDNDATLLAVRLGPGERDLARAIVDMAKQGTH